VKPSLGKNARRGLNDLGGSPSLAGIAPGHGQGNDIHQRHLIRWPEWAEAQISAGRQTEALSCATPAI